MTYGFIGLGNMASAILRGMAKAGVFAENALVGYNPSAAKVQALQNEMPLRACASAREAAEAADVVVLAVKPQVLPDVLPDGIRQAHSLCYVNYAYENIHFPSSPEALEVARRRLVFEELFLLTCGLQLLRQRRQML